MKLDRSHDIGLETYFDADGGEHRRLARITADGFRPQAARVGQAVLCLLRTEKGESFTDGTHGIPWFDQVLTLPETHLDLAQRILEEKIKAIDGVKRIRTMELRTDGRNLSGTVAVECENGESAEAVF